MHELVRRQCVFYSRSCNWNFEAVDSGIWSGLGSNQHYSQSHLPPKPSQLFVPYDFIICHSSNIFYTIFSDTFQTLSTVVGANVIQESLLPWVFELAKDVVPNIRFNVAKTLQMLVPLLDSTVVINKVKPLLQKLAEDSDKDVRFFAAQALQVCQ